jgi:hypothetical protein
MHERVEAVELPDEQLAHRPGTDRTRPDARGSVPVGTAPAGARRTSEMLIPWPERSPNGW